MKNFMITMILMLSFVTSIDAGLLTNNSNITINVVMYTNAYQPAKNNQSALGRVRNQGYLIPAGQNIDIEKSAASIDVFYSVDKPGIHVAINPNQSYTINPDIPNWTITQD